MINIAIDGPSGAGKSTIAKLLANKLGITYLDTGAMYRAVALFVVESGKDVSNSIEVEDLLDKVNISYIQKDGEDRICLNGRDVSEDIRRHEMSKYASEVSKHSSVRMFLVDMQRKIAAEKDVVLDGRDITSFVLPNAKYKFYLTATPEERARRRYEELTAKGQSVEYNKIFADIVDRDYNDMNREIAPLVKTHDSVEIDSSNLSLEEVANIMLDKIGHIETQRVTSNEEKELKNEIVHVKPVKKTKKKNCFYKGFAAFVRWVMGGIWRTKIYFKDNFLKNSKAIVICNHYSALDPCVIISKLLGKNGKVVMKDEIMKNKFIANTALELGCIPVKRGEADISAVKGIMSALNNNKPVLIFPEGTRNKGENFKEMLPFKSGVATFALKAKAPIVPLMYYKKTGIFKRNKLIVGNAFWLDEFYGQKVNAVKDEATEFIYSKMTELREETDILVEKFKGNKKKYLKYKRIQNKELLENVGSRSKE